MTKEELHIPKLVRESDIIIDKTDESEAAKAFRYLWEKYIEHDPYRDYVIREVMSCGADAEAKCRMISDILTAPPHYFIMNKT